MAAEAIDAELDGRLLKDQGTSWLGFFRVVGWINIGLGVVMFLSATEADRAFLTPVAGGVVGSGLGLLAVSYIVSAAFARHNCGLLQGAAIIKELRLMRDEVSRRTSSALVPVRCPSCGDVDDYVPGARFICAQCGHPSRSNSSD